jgi:hypothetical protein
MKKIKLMMVALLAIASSCTSDSYENNVSQTNQQKTTNPGDPGDPIEPTVYIGGFDVSGNQNQAFEWVNGFANPLTTSPDMAEVTSIYVDPVGDVYKAGQFALKPVYWVNNTMITLPSTGNYEGKANGIFVYGSDVYVVGFTGGVDYTVATIWKNGVPTFLSNSPGNASATGVYFANSNVYVSGWEETATSTTIPKLWKNNISVPLNIAADVTTCLATSVFVSGTNVYVAGYGRKQYEKYKARYWKNGVETSLLNDTSRENFAYSIFVEGTTVYTAGNDLICNACTGQNGGINVSRAKYWRNGVVTLLNDGLSTREEARSIAVQSGIVYLCGWSAPANVLGNNYNSVYWKNGVKTNLTTSGQSMANSIFLTIF